MAGRDQVTQNRFHVLPSMEIIKSSLPCKGYIVHRFTILIISETDVKKMSIKEKLIIIKVSFINAIFKFYFLP